jgi:hypothetical protein
MALEGDRWESEHILDSRLRGNDGNFQSLNDVTRFLNSPGDYVTKIRKHSVILKQQTCH